MVNGETLDRLRKKANSLPLLPGVYLMRDSRKKIIYIGKAKQLKNRVSQYFGNGNQHSDKVRSMVSNVDDFEYIVCDSEFEALILECSLIKQHSPKYNILLKDDKGYHYIKLEKRQYPNFFAVKQKDDEDAEYIGPYNSSFVVSQTVDQAKKIFKLPQCSKTFSEQTRYSRPCLNFYIGNCCAPCCHKIDRESYCDAVNQAIGFIKNGSSGMVASLREQMNEAAQMLQFERAARLRDAIKSIEKIKERQKVIASTYPNQDVIAVVSDKDSSCFEVLNFRNSALCDRYELLTDSIAEEAQARGEFLRRYYSTGRDIPPRIVIDSYIEDKELLEEWLSKTAEKKVSIIVPQKGQQRMLVEMCLSNAAECLARSSGTKGSRAAAIDELRKILGLKAQPEYIEAYDISHTAGEEAVAAMVTFLKGEPYKAGYRLFKIKSFVGNDDYRSLQEVIERRFEEYKKSETTEGFGRLPDLILIDGGRGQVSAVKQTLEQLGIVVPVFGMVKDSKHKTRAVTQDDGDVSIKANHRAFALVSAIQEEVHRCAVGYHRKRRTSRSISTTLTEIQGVGELTAKKLLQHFKTVAAIKQASAEEICAVKGVNRTVAKKIFDHFH